MKELKEQSRNVLTAIGLKDSEITGSLRISFGSLNDEEDVKIAARKIIQAVKTEEERIYG